MKHYYMINYMYSTLRKHLVLEVSACQSTVEEKYKLRPHNAQTGHISSDQEVRLNTRQTHLITRNYFPFPQV